MAYWGTRCLICGQQHSGTSVIGEGTVLAHKLTSLVYKTVTRNQARLATNLWYMSELHGFPSTHNCVVCGNGVHYGVTESARHIIASHTKEEYEQAVALFVLGGGCR